MQNSVIETLEPTAFFKWFCEICKIPHGTKNEQQLIDFLVGFAKERSIPYNVDAVGNVFMKLAASKGYEDEPAILFQAHMDMVCVKEKDVDFDFKKDAIKLAITDGKLHAQGTSLGADNAVGMATMLAIADSLTILHPALELLFTVEEEIGLVGVRAFNANQITARRMINMDCGDSHVLAICSTGSHVGGISEILEEESSNYEDCAIKLSISGGKGGHASLAIREGRACAMGCIGVLLSSLLEYPIKISYLNGLGVAIFKEAEAEIVFPKEFKGEVLESIKKNFQGLKAKYKETDPNLAIDVMDIRIPDKTLTKNVTQKVIDLLCLIKTAPYRENEETNDLITFSFLQTMSLMNGKLNLKFSVRSFDETDEITLYDYYRREAEREGFNVVLSDYYLPWQERTGSKFRERFVKIHKRLFRVEPKYERVQGGIENSILTERIPEMDAIGVAPTARGAHTTQEHLIISEVSDYWRWIMAVLNERD